MEEFGFANGPAAVDMPSIQWFPGHMAKTRRLMADSLRLVDILVELADARIPVSSRNPEIGRLAGQKPRVLLLNKCDAADDAITRRWLDYYAGAGLPALAADCRSGRGLGAFLPLVRETLAPQLAKRAAKGMAGQPVRMMVVGVPNVGKSSLINRLAGSRRAKVEDRPGVTRGRQWVSLGKGFELLDTPGVLWPKFEDPVVGEHLAFTGAVRDEILDAEGLSYRLLELLQTLYPQAVNMRYKTEIDPAEGLKGHEILERIGRKRGMLIAGGEIDTERAAVNVLDEYRGGKLGRITLEPVGRPLA